MRRLSAVVASLLVLAGPNVSAQEHVTQAKASFIFNGERIRIDRQNPSAARYAMRFAADQGNCGAPCIAPMEAADGVQTLGETEVLAFLIEEVAANRGLMVDARDPQDRAEGFIPGTVSLPQATVASGNKFRNDIFRALGAREFDGVFNFADARTLLVYDRGPSRDDAGKLLRSLLEAGYPAHKLKYYRGGMQVWSVLGFSIEEGEA